MSRVAAVLLINWIDFGLVLHIYFVAVKKNKMSYTHYTLLYLGGIICCGFALKVSEETPIFHV